MAQPRQEEEEATVTSRHVNHTHVGGSVVVRKDYMNSGGPGHHRLHLFRALARLQPRVQGTGYRVQGTAYASMRLCQIWLEV